MNTLKQQRFNRLNFGDLKFDLLAAIVVFLIAIPLCLGIALASGAPLFSGIISGIIGGIVVGLLSGSHVSVSGPAAGMAAVVVTAITQLHDFNTFLLSLTLAGVFQILIGLFRAGFIAEYVPSNVVQGLLCAIGILLIIKQIPLAFTHAHTFTELKNNLLETTEGFAVKPFYHFRQHLNFGASLITLISLTILISTSKSSKTWTKIIPAPVVVVLFGIFINKFFLNFYPTLAQTEIHLVNIPHLKGFHDFVEQLQYPNWTAWTNPQVYLYGFILAIVASLESLLNVKASEKLDKKKRYVSKNQELLAQGAGNLLSGLVGGIPITSVIVRTSVNIQAGGKTKAATIMHGLLLFIAVILIPNILNMIPISSLASILIYTGYKLTNPNIYKNFYNQGIDRFIPFLATVLSIVLFNLLLGVIIGLAISLFFILRSNSQARFDIIEEKYPNGIINRLFLPQHISFLNKASLIEELDMIMPNTQLVIDASNTTYMDKEIIELINEFKSETSSQRNISLNLVGFKDHYEIHDHIDFIHVTTYDVQAQLTPKQVLEILQEGNQRFLSDTRIHRNPKLDIKHSSNTQHPIAVILGCIDSRVPVETIFDMGFGDLFIIRIAGNVVNDDILASVEYACNLMGAKLLVVLGHTRCGAIMSACDNVQSGFITQLLEKIHPAINAEKSSTTHRNSNNQTYLNHVTTLNIAHTMTEIYQNSILLKDKVDNNQLGIVGAVYHVESGRVVFQDLKQELKAFVKTQDSMLIKQAEALL